MLYEVITAVVGHEQGVADKDIRTDPVTQAGRRMPRRVHALHVHFTDLEVLAVDEQVVELPAAAADVGCVDRITSYNVCYTKLLRDIRAGAYRLIPFI